MSKPWQFFGGTKYRDNWQRKRDWMMATGQLPKPKAQTVEWYSVAHDDWCGVYSASHCNCDPDIALSSIDRVQADEPITIELMPVGGHVDNN